MSFLPKIRTATVVRALALGALGIVTVGAFASVRPDKMMVERVVFTGQNEATPAELRHLADVHNGVRIWEIDPDRVARAVERHPWVRRATVTRSFPDQIHVEVDEFAPVALLHYGRLFYVADDGVAFLPASNLDLDYPSITGITESLEAQHPGLPRLVVRDALSLIDRLDARGLVDRDAIDEVHFAPSRGFTVRTGRSEILFRLDGTAEQLDRLATLVARGDVDVQRALHIDLGPKSVAIIRPLDGQSEG